MKRYSAGLGLLMLIGAPEPHAIGQSTVTTTTMISEGSAVPGTMSIEQKDWLLNSVADMQELLADLRAQAVSNTRLLARQQQLLESQRAQLHRMTEQQAVLAQQQTTIAESLRVVRGAVTPSRSASSVGTVSEGGNGTPRGNGTRPSATPVTGQAH